MNIFRTVAVASSLAIVSSCFAQTTSTTAGCKGPAKNQRVTLSFDHFDQASGTIWLRLRNRATWGIRIAAEIPEPHMPKLAPHEVSARYYLQEYDPGPAMQLGYPDGHKEPPDENPHPPVPKVQRFDFLTEKIIAPKEEVFFKVPKEHLARNVELILYLRYTWEDLGVETLDGPVHLVMYRGIDLPKDVQKEIK
jgi:hypothetical protein